METVSNLTSAASRAIWGDPNKSTDASEEPRSGETGDVSAGEPYDKGNEEPTSTSNTTNPTTSSTTDTNATTAMSDTTATKSDLPGSTPSTMPIRSEHETDKTGVTSIDKTTSSNDTSGVGPTPSVGTASSAQDIQKQQDADRPTDEPTSEEHARIAETKKEAEEAAKVDRSAAGPTPMTGNAGTGLQKESQGEGTGEKYDKSSGMKADGGNFDASNPGAGKEADRLLETKDVHHEVPASTDTKADSKDTSESPSHSGGKLSGLKEKIKAKLHKN